MPLPIIPNWHLVTFAATALVGFGVLKADVSDLKHAQADLRTDHDLIVRLAAKQEDEDKRLSEVRDDIKELLRQNAESSARRK